MHVSVRKMGNSSGILIPKAMLAQLGASSGDNLDISFENGCLKLSPVPSGVRVGWAEEEAAIADAATPERVLTVAPLTTGSHPAPFRISATFQNRQGLILLDQIRALDRLRLIQRLGEINAATLQAVLAKLRMYFQD